MSDPTTFQARMTRTMSYLSFLVALLFCLALFYMSGLRFNMTPSYPRGIYVFKDAPETLEVGKMVAFCPDDRDAFQTAYEREYIPKGVCPNGYRPLIKVIAGVPGDNVEIGESVVINGVEQANGKIAPLDSKGRTLSPTASLILGKGEYFMLSDYNAKSFDSRYFGPINADAVTAEVEPILMFE